MDKCMLDPWQYVAAIEHIVNWIVSFKAPNSVAQEKKISRKFCEAWGIRIGLNTSDKQRLQLL
jgi:hypothetical protein